MNWKEFKKEWQSLTKEKKQKVVIYAIGYAAAALLAIAGMAIFEYGQDKTEGLFLMILGFSWFLCQYVANTNRRIDRLKEKVDE